MKKIFKSSLSIIMCVLMLCGAFSISAFAESTEINESDYCCLPYKCYTAIGDSVAWGYGIQPEGVNKGDPSSVGLRNEGTYVDLVGKVLEKNNNAVVNCAVCSGTRLSEYRALLEAALGYENPYVHEGDAYGTRNLPREEALFAMGPDLVEWLSESDLVTFQLGHNDVMGGLVNAICAIGVNDLGFLKAESEEEILQYATDILGNMEISPAMLTKIYSTLYKEMKGVSENAEALMAEIVATAPDDADIIIVGYYNALSRFTVIPDTDSVLFNMLNYATVALNDYLSSVADKYDNVYFVATPDAEMLYEDGTPITDTLSELGDVLLKIHPSAEGQRYIANTVLDSLKEMNTCHHQYVTVQKEFVRNGLKFGIVNKKVCKDCGEVLSYGQIETPIVNIDIPEQAINNVKKSVNTSISSLLAKRSIFA